MENALIIDNQGLKAYNEILAVQERYFNLLLSEKKESGISHSPMRLILCQHLPVYTLGKNGDEGNLISKQGLNGAEFIRTSRGGDITFHGSGQLVGYPILDLERIHMGLARYIELIEEVVIRVIEKYGLHGERLKTASGVWLDVQNPARLRKICALGIRSSRWVTMHGFAFNINTDLSWFNYINPCGFTDRAVTSLSKETGSAIDFDAVTSEIIEQFLEIFEMERLENVKT